MGMDDERIELLREAGSHLAIAVDCFNLNETTAKIRELTSSNPDIDFAGDRLIVKIGKTLIHSVGGPRAIRCVRSNWLPNGKLFYDAKFYDASHTVRAAAYAVGQLGVDYLTVCCVGGAKMMKAAKKGITAGAKSVGLPVPKVLGVTVPTTMDYNDLVGLGWIRPVAPVTSSRLFRRLKDEAVTALVCQLAKLAEQAEIDGIICSPLEVEAVRRQSETSDFFIATPSCRSKWAPAGAQKRVGTPAESISAGADIVISGGPIIDPPVSIVGGSREALRLVKCEIATAISQLTKTG